VLGPRAVSHAALEILWFADYKQLMSCSRLGRLSYLIEYLTLYCFNVAQALVMNCMQSSVI
jgi:hypothetical protein